MVIFPRPSKEGVNPSRLSVTRHFGIDRKKPRAVFFGYNARIEHSHSTFVHACAYVPAEVLAEEGRITGKRCRIADAVTTPYVFRQVLVRQRT
jgi:hypothetical protein